MVLPHAQTPKGPSTLSRPKARSSRRDASKEATRRPGETFTAQATRRAEQTAQQSHQAEQTSTRIETFSLSDRRASYQPRLSKASRPVINDECDCQAGASDQERRDDQPTMRPHMPSRQQSPYITKSGNQTRARRRENAHRGITTQRVTILFDRRIAAHRASPIERRRELNHS